MKNHIPFTLAALIIAGLFTACDPTEEVVEVSGVSLDQTSLSIARGGTANLTATVSPSNATDKTVTWSSSNPAVATVERGLVTAVSVGTATITANAGGRTANCSVNVTPKEVASLRIDKGSASLNVKEVITLTASIDPPDADNKTITWSSSDEGVATVKDGKVTGVGKGVADITATVGTMSVSCKVTVSYPVSSVTIEQKTAEVEEDGIVKLKVNVETEDPDPDVTWSSNDTEIATVDKDGNVTGIKVGKTTITAKSGDKQSTCEVTVVAPAYVAKERAALIAFYNANNGDQWGYNGTNWCSDRPLREWYGIDMTEDGKHVSVIWINDDNLYGTIPKEIADLTELESLHLITETEGSGGGPLPAEIGKLKKLKSIYTWRYPITGKLPSSLFNLEQLEVLSIKHATGMTSWTIPNEIANLRNLKELCLFNCNLRGSIPSAIGNLSGLEELDLYLNNLSGTLPASMGGLINLNKIDLANNKLTGPIPTTLTALDNFWKLWPGMIKGNKFTLDDLKKARIPIPRSPVITTITGETLDIEKYITSHQYTVYFDFNPTDGEALEFLGRLANLYKANKDKGLGVITAFDNNSNEEPDISRRDDNFKNALQKVGADWPAFTRHLYDDYPKGAPFYAERGSSMWPGVVMNQVIVFGPDNTLVNTNLLDPGFGSLPPIMDWIEKTMKYTPTHYESKSYADDGKVVTLQKASVGKGVDIVITGDAFSDRQITDGTFQKAAKQAVNDLFSVEPYKSLKNRFNIYLVNAVSKHEEYFNGASTAFDCVFGVGSYVGGDDKKVLSYAQKAVGSSRMDNVAVLVLMNSLRSSGTTFMNDPEDESVYAGGSAVCYVPYKDVTVSGGLSNVGSVIIHELGGHAIAKLADEYAYREQGTVVEGVISYVRATQKWNWNTNVDFTSDPSKVLWSRFVGDSNFASENIGAYEGGYTFWRGVWRPTANSVMNNNYTHTTFNAPCRSQIWTRIMKLSEGSSWKYDYNAFVNWDKAHPTKAMSATRGVEVQADKTDHVPPVLVGKTWKEIIEGR